MEITSIESTDLNNELKQKNNNIIKTVLVWKMFIIWRSVTIDDYKTTLIKKNEVLKQEGNDLKYLYIEKLNNFDLDIYNKQVLKEKLCEDVNKKINEINELKITLEDKIETFKSKKLEEFKTLNDNYLELNDTVLDLQAKFETIHDLYKKKCDSCDILNNEHSSLILNYTNLQEEYNDLIICYNNINLRIHNSSIMQNFKRYYKIFYSHRYISNSKIKFPLISITLLSIGGFFFVKLY